MRPGIDLLKKMGQDVTPRSPSSEKIFHINGIFMFMHAMATNAPHRDAGFIVIINYILDGIFVCSKQTFGSLVKSLPNI